MAETVRMNIREFRANFSTAREPIEVLKGTETIGWFYPGSTPPLVTPRWARGLLDTQTRDVDDLTGFGEDWDQSVGDR